MSDLLPEEKLLLDAADEFEKHPERWNRGAGSSGEDSCMVLALQGFGWMRACARISNVLGVSPHELDEVYEWNDAPGRTVYDVIDAMRRAAKPEFRDEP